MILDGGERGRRKDEKTKRRRGSLPHRFSTAGQRRAARRERATQTDQTRKEGAPRICLVHSSQTFAPLSYQRTSRSENSTNLQIFDREQTKKHFVTLSSASILTLFPPARCCSELPASPFGNLSKAISITFIFHNIQHVCSRLALCFHPKRSLPDRPDRPWCAGCDPCGRVFVSPFEYEQPYAEACKYLGRYPS